MLRSERISAGQWLKAKTLAAASEIGPCVLQSALLLLGIYLLLRAEVLPRYELAPRTWADVVAATLNTFKLVVLACGVLIVLCSANALWAYVESKSSFEFSRVGETLLKVGSAVPMFLAARYIHIKYSPPDYWRLILAAVILGFGDFVLGEMLALFRERTVRELSADYVMSAKARGIHVGWGLLRRPLILTRYFLAPFCRNLLTSLEPKLPILFGGSIIVESFLEMPEGLGAMAWDAVQQADAATMGRIAVMFVLLLGLFRACFRGIFPDVVPARERP